MSNAGDDDLTSQCLGGTHVLVFGQDSVALSFVQINEQIVGIPQKSRPTCSRGQVRHAELVLVPVPRSAQDRVFHMIQQPYAEFSLPCLRLLCS